jgi:hypothetical protein
LHFFFIKRKNSMKYISIAFTLAITSFYQAFWASPTVNCWGLPGCSSDENNVDSIYGVIGNVISLMIQYITVLAVLAVMLWWIMYLLSAGDEEKAKKAKSVIIWSLVGVFLAVSAWSIVSIVNNFNIS